MKKVLLGTTALVAAVAMTADDAKAEMSLDGWAYQAFGVMLDGDDNFTEEEGLNSYQNANINFRANTQLDSGMEVGFVADMRAYSASTSIDEMRISLSDDWGTIILGSDDSASDLMNGVLWVSGNGVDSMTATGITSASWVRRAGDIVTTSTVGIFDPTTGAPTTTTATTRVGNVAFMRSAASFSGDGAGIRYFTPSMSGFRAGISYQASDDNNWTDASDNDTFTNITSVGLEYDGEISGISLGAHAGVEYAANTTFEDNVGGDDDAVLWTLGATVGAGGFSAGLNYAAHDIAVSTTTQLDAWTLGGMVAYSVGPHTVGLDGVISEATPTVGGGDAEGQGFGAHYVYSLGGGVYWDARVMMIDVENPNGTQAAEFTTFETGVGLSF